MENRPLQAEAAPRLLQSCDRPPRAFAIFRQSKRMMEAAQIEAQTEAHSPDSSPQLSRNLVFVRVSKGSKRELELARGIEPPTG